MLRVTDLGFSYPASQGRRAALTDVSFSAEPGQVLFVLGPNGSGKSTLFRLLLRLLRPSRGRVDCDGVDLATLSHLEMARKLSYIPQQEPLAFNYRVRDVVLMGRTPHLRGGRPGRDDHDIAMEALTVMRIDSLADRGMRTLSGGERQLVMIARALAQQASVMVFDEPTSALDFGNQTNLLRQVRRLAGLGYLVIVSTHNPMQALQYGDQLLLLREGRVLMSGAPGEVRETDLSELYGTRIRLFDTEEVPGLRICVPAEENPVPADTSRLPASGRDTIKGRKNT